MKGEIEIVINKLQQRGAVGSSTPLSPGRSSTIFRGGKKRGRWRNTI